MFSEVQEKFGGGMNVEDGISGRILPSPGYGDLIIFLEQVGNS